MRRWTIAALAIASLLAPTTLFAKPTGFQLEARGFGSQPTGQYRYLSASDAVKLGGGWGVKGLYGVNRHVYLGVSVAYFKNRKEYGYAVALSPPPTGGIIAPFSRATGFQGDVAMRSLRTLPVEAVIQVRSDRPRAIGWYGEGGVGITTYLGKVSIGDDARSGFQQLPSIALGAGVSYKLPSDLEAVGSLDWRYGFGSDGTVWSEREHPASLNFGVGIRYPRF